MKKSQKWCLALGLALVFGMDCQGQVGTPAGVNSNVGPPRVVSGTVFDPSGAPATGVALIVVGPTFNQRSEFKSDANGKYAIYWRAMLRTGSVTVERVYTLVARDIEHNLAAAREIDETTTNLDLHLQPGLTIFGKVEDADGKPITNATAGFDIFSGTTGNAILSPPMTADDQGRVQIPALPQGGRYSVWFLAPGYASSFPPTRIEEAETQTNRIDLPTVVLKVGAGGRMPSSQAGIVRALATRARTITGAVFDPSGAPAPGVSLLVVPPATAPNVPIQSDANGRYIIKWASRFDSNTVHVFSLIARDLGRELAAAHTIDETTTNLDLHLQPGLTIATTAQDPNGKPITNATASLIFFSGNTEAPISEPTIHSDDKGVIRFTALPQGCRYEILALGAPGHGMNALIPIEEAQTHTTRLDLPAVVLKLASLKLAGQVLGTDGQPAIGARVSFSGAGQANTNTESDATGHFAFDVCEGAVTIVANMDGVTGRAQAAGGDTNVVLQIGRNAAIATTALPNNGVVGRGPVTTTGTVFDPSGAPAPGVDLSVMPRTSLMQDVKSEADGRFSITWQPQNFGPAAVTRTTGNAFEYLLVGRDLAHNYASTARIDEKTTNLDMRLREGLALSSSVRDINGAPVKTATVRLIMNALGWTRPLDRPLASVDEQGVFTLSALPQGQAFSLTATAPGFGIVTVPVTATETQTARLQLPPIKLAMVNRPLEGVVVGSNNQPVPGATVRVGGEGQPTVTAVTDANGRFALKVCEGTVGVSASVPRNLYGQASSATVQARAGDVNVVLKLAVPGAAPAAPAPAPDDLR